MFVILSSQIHRILALTELTHAQAHMQAIAVTHATDESKHDARRMVDKLIRRAVPEN